MIQDWSRLLLAVLLAGVCHAADPFTLVIDTRITETGSSDASTFVLPLNSGYTGTYRQDVAFLAYPASYLAYTRTYAFTYNAQVDWGDGTTETITNATAGFPNITHAYATPGAYAVRITGQFPTLSFNNQGDRLKLLAVAQWGDVVWESMYGAFSGCANLQITATDLPQTGQVEDFTTAWRGCAAMTSFPAIDTSAAVVLEETWYECSGLTSFPLISTGSVQSFFHSWIRCTGLTTFPALDTHSALTFHSTWNGCTALTGAFPALDFSHATDLEYAWVGCPGITAFTATDFSAARNLGRAWYGCSGLTSFPAITCPVVESVFATWRGCTGLTAFPSIDLGLVTNFTQAWYGCSGLSAFPVIDVGAGTDFNATWQNCTGLMSFPALAMGAALDVSGAWNGCAAMTTFQTTQLGNVTYFGGAWSGCRQLAAFPLIDSHSGTSFSNTWMSCVALTAFPAIDTSAGLNFTGSWNGCTGLNGQAFPTLDMRNMTIGTNTFLSVTLETASYAAILNHLNTYNANTGVTFHGGSSKYNGSALAARTNLTTAVGSGGKGWTITDGGVTTQSFNLQIHSGAGASFTLPLDGVSTYNAWVTWGDGGTWEAITGNTPIAHAYPAANTLYVIKLLENGAGGFPTLKFNNGAAAAQARQIQQWGTNTWSTMNAAFYGCAQLLVTATDQATAGTGGVTNWASAFRSCAAFNASPASVSKLAQLNLSGLTDATDMFNGCTLPSTSYSELLISLDNQNAHTGVTFHGGAGTYTAAGAAARSNLTTAVGSGGKGWTITDGGAQVARYWIIANGVTANWNTTTSWSASSGGASGASIPTLNNRVVFDAVRTGNCTLNADGSAAEISFDPGYTGTFAFGNQTLTVYGSVDLRSGGVFTAGTGGLSIAATSTLIPPAATSIPKLTISNGWSATLATHDLEVAGTLAIGTGSNLVANGRNLRVGGNWANTGGTFTAGTSTVTLFGATATVSGSTTFNNLTLTAPSTVNFTSNTTQTINGTFTATGSPGNLITIQSTTPGSVARLSKTGGSVTCDYLSLRDSAARGTATWNAGANSTDVSGNSGWVFPGRSSGFWLAGD